ncbi:MAG TPA: patatin-like phospholipase family protein [Candidatus Limnocylindria bacterium]|nr:patatin-like phospholipase family protein [Candidatus Limnocylindria bacterium]
MALVLSGGGARGAYEAGVLSYCFEVLPRRLGRAPRFDIITGTSVGAIHACYVAGSGQDRAAAERLRSIWSSLSLDAVYRFGIGDMVRVPLRLLSAVLPVPEPAEAALPERMTGLLDTSWLRALVMDRVHWHGIRRNFERGRLSALAVSTTEVATGGSVVFVDRRADAPLAPDADPHVTYCETRIGPRHALASAAIPLLFPTIRIADAYHCDGGLRLNTPLAPAIHLGADRVLVVGLRYQATPEELLERRRRREANVMSPTYLAGKALNALLLDRVETDLERLRLFNAILERGTAVYGPDFVDRINESIAAERGRPYRIVDSLHLKPSQDLGALASECFERDGSQRSLVGRTLAGIVARGALGEADLLSYLFFDRAYTERLIEIGRADAEAAADALCAFLQP